MWLTSGGTPSQPLSILKWKRRIYMKKIVLFDGICHFCQRSVQFILKRDKKDVFVFASIQSEIGQQLLEKHHLPPEINSLVLIDDDTFSIKSTAVLNICKQLKNPWPLLYIFMIIPSFIRDKIYDLIAKNRYRFFKENNVCTLPTEQERKKFL